MMRNTQKKSAAQHEAAGTSRPTREKIDLYPVVDPDNWEPPIKPDWLKGRASKVWDEKVEQYRRRGQVCRGFEAALAQYASLEAQLIMAYAKGKVPTSNLIQQHRQYCASFYDTPSSTTVSVSKAGVENPFLQIYKHLKAGTPTED